MSLKGGFYRWEARGRIGISWKLSGSLGISMCRASGGFSRRWESYPTAVMMATRAKRQGVLLRSLPRLGTLAGECTGSPGPVPKLRLAIAGSVWNSQTGPDFYFFPPPVLGFFPN
ncbi:hypothetical protein ACLB2K_019310 [Fragaria x ananassa]